jgi:hypothetical protein
MHPLFAYIVVQVLEDERRKADTYLPEPDLWNDPDPRPAAPRPSRGRRSPTAALAGMAAAARNGASRLGRRLAPEG